MSSSHYQLIIIGAGALGSFHAYHGCKKGLKVLLLEKDYQPMEATVRNFGQIVPSGMSQGKWQLYGRRSLEIYQEIHQKLDISVRREGSVYLASDQTESTLLEELSVINRSNDYTSVMLSQKDCLHQFPGLKKEYCMCGLFFPDEITVEPRTMIHRVIAYLEEQLGLTYSPNTLITFCDYANGRCVTRDNMGNEYTSDQVIICNGRDYSILFPEIFFESDIQVSKLQMMKTVPQPNYSLKGSVLTGLSIRRYESFKECPSYTSLQAEDVAERFKKWGIHILFKQAMDGSIIIGDSHEYADAKQQGQLGFEINQEINHHIIEEAKRILNLPSWEIARCWNGYYGQCRHQDIFNQEVVTHIQVITAIGGKGMTASPALAEETIQQLF